MANSLFNSLGPSQKLPGAFGDMQNMLNKLNQFRQTIQGDPKQQAQQLLNSGQMSQDQYNRLSQMATQIQNMLVNKQ